MKKISRVILILTLTLLLILFLCFGIFWGLTADVTLQEDKLKAANTTIELYDCNDSFVKKITYMEGQAAIKQSELPLVTKQAFCAVEDKNFYSHKGLSFKRMAAALLKNIKSGSYKEGASTISQQLVKNTHLSSEKTMKRKLKEIKLTLQLENQYTKDEILEMYLNTIYFGHNCYGITNAAEFYFKKNPKDLSVAESAMLAGLLKSPNNYSPFLHAEQCKARRDFVIEELFKEGKITSKERENAINEPLPTQRQVESESAYFLATIREAEELCSDKLYGNYKIYTYLDKSLNDSLKEFKTETDCSFLVGDNTTKGIQAYYSTTNLQLRRSPGSTIKPLAVYAPAIEEGLISPATKINDEFTNFNGYTPSNFNNSYHGLVSARYALIQSLNIPAVKIFNSLGVEKATKYLERMNLPLTEEDKNLALALGGCQEGFTLKEILSAYGCFSNDGYFTPYRFISRIEKDGKAIYEREKEEIKVFSEDTVSLVNNMLKDCAQNGTAKKLKQLNIPVYAKTGTSGTKEKNIDAYTISYTAQNTVAVWLGNKDYSPIKTTGGGTACLINREIVRMLDCSQTEIPSKNIVKVALDKDAYDENGEILLADSEAPEIKKTMETFSVYHLPKRTSSAYSRPEFQEPPSIQQDNNTISIVLFGREYYIYNIIRKNNRGEIVNFTTKDKLFIDNSIQENEIYEYTVTARYKSNLGESVTLPRIYVTSFHTSEDETNLNEKKSLPESWWRD